MGFLGVYRAIYDYAPQSEGELAISEGDVLYVIEKSDEDDWWKAKKKAGAEDDDEPVGLIPNNYVEEVRHEVVGGCYITIPSVCSAQLTNDVGRRRVSSAGPLRVHTPDRRRAILSRRCQAASI
jgi:hypothetical protein